MTDKIIEQNTVDYYKVRMSHLEALLNQAYVCINYLHFMGSKHPDEDEMMADIRETLDIKDGE